MASQSVWTSSLRFEPCMLVRRRENLGEDGSEVKSRKLAQIKKSMCLTILCR